MTKDSPHTVAGAAAALGKVPAPHSLLIPKQGTVGNYGRSLSNGESIPLRHGEGPNWTSALFLPHHLRGPAKIGYQRGSNDLGLSMSVQHVAVTAEIAAGRRASATLALVALVVLLAL